VHFGTPSSGAMLPRGRADERFYSLNGVAMESRCRRRKFNADRNSSVFAPGSGVVDRARTGFVQVRNAGIAFARRASIGCLERARVERSRRPRGAVANSQCRAYL